ncbi:MAG: DNA repair exonuclease, partial [Eggerthellaceae bacterium]|nr:DNA repair exonuclease [Eggerthellaceae bacterium]
MAKLTFIHAADLHLGAPFKGLSDFDASRARALSVATGQAYATLIKTALDKKVDFVVLAGDTFDQKKPTHQEHIQFLSGLKNLNAAGIPVYICTGNHDPFITWQNELRELPPNVSFFSAEGPSYFLFEKEGTPLCVLGGTGFKTSKWGDRKPLVGLSRRDMLQSSPHAADAEFAIGVLHTDLGKAYAPCTVNELTECGLDFWALGHIHKRYADSSGAYAFAGCMQGHDINEAGTHGFNVVTLETSLPNKIEFVPSATIEWAQIFVDAGDCSSLKELYDKALDAVLQRKEETEVLTNADLYVRVTLTGQTSLFSKLRHEDVVAE